MPDETRKTNPPSSGLGAAIDAELAVLARIEDCFKDELTRVETSTMPPFVKRRLLQQLEAGRSINRQPHVLRLAELYEKLQKGALFGAETDGLGKTDASLGTFLELRQLRSRRHLCTSKGERERMTAELPT